MTARIFNKKRANNVSVYLLMLLACTLAYLDKRHGLSDKFSSYAFIYRAPVVELSSLLTVIKDRVDFAWLANDDKFLKLKLLEQENLKLFAQNKKLSNLLQEMHKSKLFAKLMLDKKLLTKPDKLIFAKNISISYTPTTKKLMIDKGSEHGVKENDPVLCDAGLVGIVLDVGQYHSTVLMITADNFGVPVKTATGKYRGIAKSVYGSNNLILELFSQADIKIGENIITSGLGNSFPVGYQVGKVVNVTYDRAAGVTLVSVLPGADLASLNNLLVIAK